jgi:hypothetical protein
VRSEGLRDFRATSACLNALNILGSAGWTFRSTAAILLTDASGKLREFLPAIRSDYGQTGSQALNIVRLFS